MDAKGLSTYFLLFLIAGALILAFQIFLPFLVPLALAAAFAAVLQPYYLRLKAFLRGHDSIAASLMLLVILIGVLVPLAIMLFFLGAEAAKLYGSLLNGSFAASISTILQHLQHFVPQSVMGPNYSDAVAGNLSAYASDALAWLSGHVTDAFSSIANILLNLFVFFVALFFFLRDGESLKRSIIELSPLHDHDDKVIFERLSLAVNSVVRGNLLVALMRGIASSIGFLFFGIPNPLLWGMMAGIIGLIPSIGIFMVFIPAVLYLYFFGGMLPAIGLALWGLFIMGLVDNVLAQYLVGSGMQVHPLFVFLAIFGGIAFFGPVGIFLGPLTLTLLFAFLSIYASPHKHGV